MRHLVSRLRDLTPTAAALVTAPLPTAGPAAAPPVATGPATSAAATAMFRSSQATTHSTHS